MKILITGSSGFIGNELVNHLSEKHEIVEFDLANGQDLLDYNKLKEAMKGCEAVVHLAAIGKPLEDKTFSDYFQKNCVGTLNVAKAAAETDVKRIVYASSTSYYGMEKGIPFVKPIKESNPVLTQHVTSEELECRDCDIAYSTSKVIAEQILANYGMTQKLQVIILRLGPTREKGENRPFLGINLKMENALQSLETATTTNRKIQYEAFTITDKLAEVDLSKAEELLDYKPT